MGHAVTGDGMAAEEVVRNLLDEALLVWATAAMAEKWPSSPAAG
jgi:hypothetical protein